jgi:FlaA1/EpsC-like NDP-sugar epimerase
MLVSYDFLKGKVDERKNSQRVLVYGVGSKSVSLLSRLKASSRYNIVAFLQYGSSDVSHVISDIKAFYVRSVDEFKNLIDTKTVDAILFSTEEDVQVEKDRIIRYAIENGIKILFAPPIDELVDGKLIHNFRKIEIEDLLMRPEIKISMDEIVENFKNKTIMVTGAAGSIGSELCRQLLIFGIDKLILFDNAETPMHNLRLELEEKYHDLKIIPVIGDVRLLPRLDYVFKKWHPQVVFHAAAYKHVPLMEDNPCEAVLVNVAGSRNVADKCLEYGAEMMVMVSTDKAVNPTNIMGCTKRLAEIYVQSMGLALECGRVRGKTKFVTTRFGNVLGSNGSVIPRFREQIAKGGPVTVTHPEITRFFMTIPEACRLVMEAATMSTGNQIFVFDMGESVKIDDLARRMIQLAGFTPDVDIKIEYTGLRPGEKLYEEVLANTENTLPTNHSRIRIAKVRDYDYEEAKNMVAELERLSRGVEVSSMVCMMKQIVPEFISNNSRYQEYDKIK